jgi:hypothetical protein
MRCTNVENAMHLVRQVAGKRYYSLPPIQSVGCCLDRCPHLNDDVFARQCWLQGELTISNGVENLKFPGDKH